MSILDRRVYTRRRSGQVPSVGGHLVASVFRGGLLYLLYVDESGRPEPSTTRHFVVAGLALHEEDCYPFTRSLHTLQRRWVGYANVDLELHATDMWNGRREWSRFNEARRRALIRAVLRHIARWQSPTGRKSRLFGVVVKKDATPTKVMERAHEELFARFDEFMTRLYAEGQPHRSLVVADNSSYETLVQTMTPRWKRGGRLGPLHSFIEVPLYVDSGASRLVQAADLVAWAIWQYYENGHPEHLQQVHGSFDSDGGILHGMVHLRRGYRHCRCAPCVSRQTKAIPARLPKL